MRMSLIDTVTDTVTERSPSRSANARLAYASLSVSLSILQIAYQQDLSKPKNYEITAFPLADSGNRGAV